MRELVFYQVFHENTPLCQAGSEEDAKLMVSFSPGNRHYKRMQFLPTDTVDVSAEEVLVKELPEGTGVTLPV